VRSAYLFIITDKARSKGRKVGGVGVMKDEERKLDEIEASQVERGKVVSRGEGSGEGV